eukprot:306858-Hanusia_phi.AAC.3
MNTHRSFPSEESFLPLFLKEPCSTTRKPQFLLEPFLTCRLHSNWNTGHPPLRGTPDYPVGHPGYFNGVNAVRNYYFMRISMLTMTQGIAPGYTGGATDTWGSYSIA